MLRILRKIIYKDKSVKDVMKYRLSRELRRASNGTMPKEVREEIAERTINRMDFNNPYQMHKSISGYADILADDYNKRKAK